MNDEVLRHVYHELFGSKSKMPRRRYVYCDAVIVFVCVLGVLNNHSPRWAHDKRNWPLWCRWLKIPSYSQLMKRLKEPHIQALIDALNLRERRQLPGSIEKTCDGKPLVVSDFSKDPDARFGKAYGKWRKGYRLHLIADSLGGIDAFCVTSMDGGESTATARLISQVELVGVTLRGDSNYDRNPLYRRVAEAGGRLLAPRKRPHTRLGHRPHHPDRLRAIAELEASEANLAEHELHRIRVEQSLAHMTNLPFGLAPLPNCVRRLERVQRWVSIKILLYHVYLNLLRRQQLAA